MKAALTVALLALAVTGCARTVYRNLHGSDPAPVETEASLAAHPKDVWQNFFTTGFAPHFHQIDAGAQCGGDAHVATIETEHSIGTVLAAIVTFDIYSPWSAHVTCDHPR